MVPSTSGLAKMDTNAIDRMRWALFGGALLMLTNGSSAAAITMTGQWNVLQLQGDRYVWTITQKGTALDVDFGTGVRWRGTFDPNTHRITISYFEPKKSPDYGPPSCGSPSAQGALSADGSTFSLVGNVFARMCESVRTSYEGVRSCGTGCDLCGECDPARGCRGSPPQLDPNAEHASIVVRKNGAIPADDEVEWRWRGRADDIPNPMLGRVGLCVYRDGGAVQPYEVLASGSTTSTRACPGPPCWKETRRGYRYYGGRTRPGGVASIRIARDKTGDVSLYWRGKGAVLTLPDGLPEHAPVIVQLVIGAGIWRSDFRDASTTTPSTFRARY